MSCRISTLVSGCNICGAQPDKHDASRPQIKSGKKELPMPLAIVGETLRRFLLQLGKQVLQIGTRGRLDEVVMKPGFFRALSGFVLPPAS